MLSSALEIRRSRVLRLIDAARRIADPGTEFGRIARQRLITTTGLSPENVELGLIRCLESNPSDIELRSLLDSTPEAPCAHVVLSANVFVAAHRAIALALSCSGRVHVRPSRREPTMAELLNEAAPGLFELTDSINAMSGDHVFAYGSNESLAAIKAGLAPGVTFHAHGSGIGVALVDLTAFESRKLAAALAMDTALFDQRGCLSPRCVLALGDEPQVAAFASDLAGALSELEVRVPRGLLTSEESAEISRFRDTAAYAADLLSAGSGWVSASGAILIPPPGRNLHVVCAADLRKALISLGAAVASIGSALTPDLETQLRTDFPNARWAALGHMQTPPFDGPVDLRAPTHGELIG